MPKFKVEAKTNHPAADAYQKIRSLLERDVDLRKMDANYTCKFNDSAMSGNAKGSKFEADLAVKANGAGSTVEIEVSLPMMLTPLKGVVQSTLQKKLDAALS